MDIATLFGFLASALTTISFMPQVVKTVRTRSTRDLSFGICLILTVSVACWVVYSILKGGLWIFLGKRHHPVPHRHHSPLQEFDIDNHVSASDGLGLMNGTSLELSKSLS